MRLFLLLNKSFLLIRLIFSIDVPVIITFAPLMTKFFAKPNPMPLVEPDIKKLYLLCLQSQMIFTPLKKFIESIMTFL